MTKTQSGISTAALLNLSSIRQTSTYRTAVQLGVSIDERASYYDSLRTNRAMSWAALDEGDCTYHLPVARPVSA